MLFICLNKNYDLNKDKGNLTTKNHIPKITSSSLIMVIKIPMLVVKVS